MIEKCEKCHRPFTKQRSDPQNRSYWKFRVEPLAEHLGYTRDEMHEIIKWKFLTEVRYLKRRDGTMEEIKVTRSTTSLTTAEFAKLMDDVGNWGGQLGCVMQDPNQPPLEN